MVKMNYKMFNEDGTYNRFFEGEKKMSERYKDDIGEIFARKRRDGNYDILYVEDGYPVTRLDANVYPVGSDFGARYEHPEGIVLTLRDVKKLGIEIE